MLIDNCFTNQRCAIASNSTCQHGQLRSTHNRFCLLTFLQSWSWFTQWSVHFANLQHENGQTKATVQLSRSNIERTVLTISVGSRKWADSVRRGKPLQPAVPPPAIGDPRSAFQVFPISQLGFSLFLSFFFSMLNIFLQLTPNSIFNFEINKFLVIELRIINQLKFKPGDFIRPFWNRVDGGLNRSNIDVNGQQLKCYCINGVKWTVNWSHPFGPINGVALFPFSLQRTWWNCWSFYTRLACIIHRVVPASDNNNPKQIGQSWNPNQTAHLGMG